MPYFNYSEVVTHLLQKGGCQVEWVNLCVCVCVCVCVGGGGGGDIVLYYTA